MYHSNSYYYIRTYVCTDGFHAWNVPGNSICYSYFIYLYHYHLFINIIFSFLFCSVGLFILSLVFLVSGHLSFAIVNDSVYVICLIYRIIIFIIVLIESQWMGITASYEVICDRVRQLKLKAVGHLLYIYFNQPTAMTQ